VQIYDVIDIGRTKYDLKDKMSMTDEYKSSIDVEDLILAHILNEESFSRKVIPHILPKYFTDRSIQIVFEEIDAYGKKYSSMPTKEALSLELEVRGGLEEDEVQGAFNKISQCFDIFHNTDSPDIEWLTDTTEKYIQERAVYLAIMDSIEVIEDSDRGNGEIPELLNDALAVCLDADVGHDFFAQSSERYQFYHRDTPRIPFDISMMNTITRGGLPKKTETILLGATGTGKTACMCHMAAADLLQGIPVLYITMEMAEERISERVDANILDVTMDELEKLTEKQYMAAMGGVREKTMGELFVKEYPPVSAHAGHFTHLLRELKIKKGFVPEKVYIDYLGICISARASKGDNTNTSLQKVAEDLRGLAVVHDFALVTGAQVNRGGFGDNEFDLDSIADSFGITMTADVILGLYTNDDLKKSNQLIISQLKNRFGDISVNKRFVVGLDYSKMRMFDSNQTYISGSDDDSEGMPDYIKEAKEDKKNGFAGFTV